MHMNSSNKHGKQCPLSTKADGNAAAKVAGMPCFIEYLVLQACQVLCIKHRRQLQKSKYAKIEQELLCVCQQPCNIERAHVLYFWCLFLHAGGALRGSEASPGRLRRSLSLRQGPLSMTRVSSSHCVYACSCTKWTQLVKLPFAS